MDQLPAAGAELAAVGRVGAALRLAVADRRWSRCRRRTRGCAGRCGGPRRRRTTCGCPRCRRSLVDWSPPARCIAPVTPTSRSPLSDSDTDSGSISQRRRPGVADRPARHEVGGAAGDERAGRRDRRRLARRRRGRRRRTGRARRRSPSRSRPGRVRRCRRLRRLLEFLDLAVARGHRLGAPMHDAGVGVTGAGGERRLDRRGRHVEMSHVPEPRRRHASPVIPCGRVEGCPFTARDSPNITGSTG